LLIAWHATSWNEVARNYEHRLLKRFADIHDGRRPFANLTESVERGDRAGLARLGPPTLLRAPRAQPLRQGARRERERIRKAYWQALDEAVDLSDAKQRLSALVDELEGAGYTAAAKCLADDLDALVVQLRYPTRHRRRWRSTNMLERSLGDVKRRTKVIGRFPGEDSCLTLV
jgi:hypothetical protein